MDVNPAEAATSGEEKSSSTLDSLVGISVVLLATFLGLVNVKSGNVSQQMEKAQSDRNNMWLWYQARNLREEMYRTAADEMRALGSASPTPALEQMIALYEKKAKDQEAKKEEQSDLATQAKQRYEDLGSLDDKFDICEASLALALALMGVTALTKKKWLFVVALVPAAFGLFMGISGFAGWATPIEELPVLGPLFKLIL